MEETSGESAAAAPSEPRGRWVIIALCAVAMGLSFMDRGILPLFVNRVKTDLHITDVQFSLLVGLAFTLFFAACGIPIAWLVDTKPRPKVLGLGITLWSLATMLTAFGRSFASVFTARLVVGIGESTCSPASQSMAVDMFIGDKLGRAMSTVSVGVAIGAPAALLFGGALSKALGPSQAITLPVFGVLHAWQFVFLVLGAPGLILAPIMFFLVRDPARRRVALTAEGGEARSTYFALLRFFWAHRTTVFFNLGGYAIYGMASSGLGAWAPAHFLRHFHAKESVVGVSLGIPLMLGNTLALLGSGWWIDNRISKGHSDGAMQFSRNVAALGLIPLLAFPFMPTFALSVAALLVTTCLLGSGYACSSMSMLSLAPNQMRAQFGASFLMIANVCGYVISPWLIAVINGATFHDPAKIGVSAALVGAVALVIAIIMLTLGQSHYRRSMEIVVATTRH